MQEADTRRPSAGSGTRASIAIALATIVLAVPASALASPPPAVVAPVHTERLQSDGPNSAMHGWSTASDGATLVVGARNDETETEPFVSSVYVFPVIVLRSL